LGDVGVLAKQASEVTPYGGNGIGKGPGQKMKKGLFFNGIYMPGDHLVIHEAE